MSRRSAFRSFEPLEYLAGLYEIAHVDKAERLCTFRFRLCRNFGYLSLNGMGIRVIASHNGVERELFPNRIDVGGSYIGLRLPYRAFPKGWRGECEIIFHAGKRYVCHPDRGPIVLADVEAASP